MNISGKIGIGFRRGFAEDFLDSLDLTADFIEFAPENWMGMGGAYKKLLHKATDRYPSVCHGLSLSLGAPDDLNWEFLRNLKSFLKEHNVLEYSEHLSFNSFENAHLYDLLPIPFREDAVKHVSERIKQVQDFLERPIAIENVSYYTPVAAEMTEQEFINAIIDESGCNLLLDINNVYVNSFNHDYDARSFLDALPLNKVSYMHIAGHEKISNDLIIDTHGHSIIEPVYSLLDYVAQKMSSVPVLLERDFNFPELEELQQEIDHIEEVISKHWRLSYVA